MNAALAPHPMQTLIAGTAGVSPSTKQCRGCMQEEFPTCPVVQSMRVAPSGATRIKRARVPSLIVVMHMQCSKARSSGAYHTCEQMQHTSMVSYTGRPAFAPKHHMPTWQHCSMECAASSFRVPHSLTEGS